MCFKVKRRWYENKVRKEACNNVIKVNTKDEKRQEYYRNITKVLQIKKDIVHTQNVMYNK